MTACRPGNSPTIESISTQIGPTLPPVADTEAPALPTAAPSPTVTVAQDSITPALVRVCPNPREVSFFDLDLASTTRLIVKQKNDPTNSIWTLSRANQSFTPIGGLAPAPKAYINVQSISPNHKWLAYFMGQVGLDNTALWIGSVDGEVQQVILPDVESYGNSVSWLDDETIIIFGQPDNREEPIPTVILSLFNGGQAFLPPLPDDTIFLGYGLIDNQLSAIYFDGRWKLFNYTTGKTKTIFPWLKSEEWLNDYYVLKNDFYVRMVDGRIDLKIAVSHGLDAALSLNPSANYTDYAAIMREIILPGENVTTRVLGWNNNLVFLERYDPNQDRQNVLFYALDIYNERLYDYCLDRSDGTINFVVSNDGRFLAWSKYSNPYEVVVLAVETGEVALLKDVELVGWGEVETP